MRHTNPTPCKGKSLIIKLLPLQGALFNIYTLNTQGAALGYVVVVLSARID